MTHHLHTDEADQLGLAATNLDWAASVCTNGFSGIDIVHTSGQVVRVYLDEPGNYDQLAFARFAENDGPTMATAQYSGPFDVDRTLALLSAIAPRVEARV